MHLGQKSVRIPKRNACTGRGTAKPLTEYSKGRRKRIKCKGPGVRTENLLYDRNGNLKEDGRWQYFYDYQKRLTRIHEPSTGEEAQFLFDARGRRIVTVVAGRSTYLVSDGQRFTSINYLPNSRPKIQTTAERGYLEEALICFRNKAFRAAVVMC